MKCIYFFQAWVYQIIFLAYFQIVFSDEANPPQKVIPRQVEHLAASLKQVFIHFSSHVSHALQANLVVEIFQVLFKTSTLFDIGDQLLYSILLNSPLNSIQVSSFLTLPSLLLSLFLLLPPLSLLLLLPPPSPQGSPLSPPSPKVAEHWQEAAAWSIHAVLLLKGSQAPPFDHCLPFEGRSGWYHKSFTFSTCSLRVWFWSTRMSEEEEKKEDESEEATE